MITIVGSVCNDPELRYTTSGRAALKLRVACRDRVLDRVTNEWKDGDQLFIDVEVWADQAEHVAAVAARGVQVIVTGKVRTREYTTREGEKRSVTEVKDATVGISMIYQSVTGVERDRPKQPAGQQAAPQQQQQQPPAQQGAQQGAQQSAPPSAQQPALPADSGNPFQNAF